MYIFQQTSNMVANEPARSSVNASPLTLRATAHDSKSRRVVNPYRAEEFHLQSFTDL